VRSRSTSSGLDAARPELAMGGSARRPDAARHAVMGRSLRRAVVAALAFLIVSAARLRAEDGYDLWLRYPRVADAGLLAEYQGAVGRLVVQGDSPTLRAAREELV